MATRRRRPGVVWLPNTGENAVGGATTNSLINVVQLDVGGPLGTTVSGASPVVLDVPSSSGVAGADTLSDFEGSAYRLRRIVGKIFAIAAQDPEQEVEAPAAGIFTAGYIILRVDQNGAPIGGTTGANYNPQLLDSERDPWIWRRSWFLSNNANPLTTGVVGDFLKHGPQSTMEYGSVLDGGHVDAKTARSVKDEERLFFVVALTALSGASAEQQDFSVRVWYENRVLASMYKQSGNRRNASR